MLCYWWWGPFTLQSFFKITAGLICFLCITVIVFVLILEYKYSVKPCEWCVYQRYPYIFLFVLNLIWLIKPINYIAQGALNTFVMTINLLLPIVHVLIEKGILYIKCSPILGKGLTIHEKLSMMKGHASCSKITWKLLGWSMAQWHVIFALILLIIYIAGLIYGQKRLSSPLHSR